MRGSIASLTILAFVFGFALTDTAPPRGAADVAGLALVAIAATSGAYEIYRALAWKTYPVSACSVMDVAQATRRRVPQTNYIARVDARLQAIVRRDARALADDDMDAAAGRRAAGMAGYADHGEPLLGRALSA
ncbi:MAG: hypothetical protein V9G24_12575 [Rhodoblastus sp.]